MNKFMNFVKDHGISAAVVSMVLTVPATIYGSIGTEMLSRQLFPEKTEEKFDEAIDTLHHGFENLTRAIREGESKDTLVTITNQLQSSTIQTIESASDAVRGTQSEAGVVDVEVVTPILPSTYLLGIPFGKLVYLSEVSNKTSFKVTGICDEHTNNPGVVLRGLSSTCLNPGEVVYFYLSTRKRCSLGFRELRSNDVAQFLHECPD